jgi:hypothetical protein
MAEQKYHRLTRTRARRSFAVAFMSHSSLWLGEDHLLCVDSTGYTETYKRFYFRDIQAITVRQTRRRLIWNWILGILVAFCLASCNFNSLFKSQPDAKTIVFLSIALFVFGIPLLFNNIFGRTCACQLRTAVQIEDLPSLSRVRKTHKILEKIRPLIIATQGQLSPEEISARIREAVQLILPQSEDKPPVIS